MVERPISVIQKHTPLVRIDTSVLAQVLREKRYPFLNVELDNKPVRRRRIYTAGQNREKYGNKVIVKVESLVQDEEVEDFVYSAREMLEGKKIKRPKYRRSNLFTKLLYKSIYKPLEKENPDEEEALKFAVNKAQRDAYLQAARNNFEGYTIYDKKTNEVIHLTPAQAKERAERTITKIVGNHLERTVGAILAHEYGHSSPEAKRKEEEFNAKHPFREAIATGAGIAGYIGAGILLASLHLPILVGIGLASVIGAITSTLPYIPLAKPYLRMVEESAFAATTKENIMAFAKTIRVDYQTLQKRLFPKPQN